MSITLKMTWEQLASRVEINLVLEGEPRGICTGFCSGSKVPLSLGRRRCLCFEGGAGVGGKPNDLVTEESCHLRELHP